MTKSYIIITFSLFFRSLDKPEVKSVPLGVHSSAMTYPNLSLKRPCKGGRKTIPKSCCR